MSIQEIEKQLEKVIDGNITIDITKEGESNRIRIIAITPEGNKYLMDDLTPMEPLDYILHEAMLEWGIASGNGHNCLKKEGIEEAFNRD